MSWNRIVGHSAIKNKFRRAIHANRLASTFMFVGPAGIGKATFAKKLAQALLCEHDREDPFEPCGSCPACQQVESQTHPDLVLISKPKDKNALPIELFIGDGDHRRQEGMCHEIGLKPFRGGRKIAIIDDADFLKTEAANCLLKTLEEPPPNSILILIGTSEQKQLPTIRSRSQVIRFAPLQVDEVRDLLIEKELVGEDANADRMAEFSAGSVKQALMLSEVEIFEFRESWLRALASLDPGQNDFAKTFTAFVDGAGKDAAMKRDRIRLACDWAHGFYRNLMLQLEGIQSEADSVLAESVADAARRFEGSSEQVANCVARCLVTYGHVAANLNQATLIESLLSDLGRLIRNDPVSTVC